MQGVVQYTLPGRCGRRCDARLTCRQNGCIKSAFMMFRCGSGDEMVAAGGEKSGVLKAALVSSRC